MPSAYLLPSPPHACPHLDSSAYFHFARARYLILDFILELFSSLVGCLRSLTGSFSSLGIGSLSSFSLYLTLYSPLHKWHGCSLTDDGAARSSTAAAGRWRNKHWAEERRYPLPVLKQWGGGVFHQPHLSKPTRYAAPVATTCSMRRAGLLPNVARSAIVLTRLAPWRAGIPSTVMKAGICVPFLACWRVQFLFFLLLDYASS